ncbi:MAG: PEP-CTERM sorting domain-containing protein [Novosphingobium sp.]|nr:PEP-CTERM sorting domain-containing protein [Novosphingobium sp.]
MLLVSASQANATTVIIYTGNPFTQSAGPLGSQPVNPAWGSKVLAHFTLPVAANYTGTVTTATDWKVSSDGAFVIDLGNADQPLSLSLDLVNGLPAYWDFGAYSGNWQILSTYSSFSGAHHDAATTSLIGQANVANALGVWSVASVPEPATWAMMIGGFCLVGAAMRRRKQRIAVSYA